MTSKYINALLIERLGYERRGLTDRVAMVDAELRELGYDDHKYQTQSEIETAAIEPAAEQTSIKRGKKKKI